jgi:glycosyltransferase involved in cell wall biosynthesis
MRGKQVQEMLAMSDVYIMPSVSEPFGISPLEAMQVGCPSIISRQSGCAEILQHAIKTDYWDIDAMADAIYAIVKYPAMYKSLHELGCEEVNNIRWYDAGLKVRRIYDGVINHTL